MITPKSKILVLINPNNPTGTVTPPDEVRKIAELCIKHDLIVLSDEIYARLIFGKSPCSGRPQPCRACASARSRCRAFPRPMR